MSHSEQSPEQKQEGPPSGGLVFLYGIAVTLDTWKGTWEGPRRLYETQEAAIKSVDDGIFKGMGIRWAVVVYPVVNTGTQQRGV
jgi:hypothetical protein